ncbi:MAG: hypothetical protein ACHQ6T_07695 [Myxococcota bacterium]
MNRSINRLAVLALAPLAAFAFASAAPAKDKKPTDPKAACQAAVHSKIKKKHAGAHDIQLTPSREWQPTSTQNGIGGTGTLTAADKKPRNFEWTCVYETKTGKITDVDVEGQKKK